MTHPELSILDVGHGNTAVLQTDIGIVVFDASPGSTLIEFLEDQNVNQVDFVLISHADKDHIGGLLLLLTSLAITVGTVLLNHDTIKETETWEDVRFALEDASRRGEVEVITALNEATSLDFDSLVGIEVLAPSIAMTLGRRDQDGNVLTSNAMSAVVRLTVDDVGQVLLTGDLDTVGLENLLASAPDVRSRVLVFPHHGGSPGSDNAVDFAKSLCDAVNPEVVVFSIGRGRYGTPRPEIVEGVRASVADAHIACTQLSENCAASLPSVEPDHLSLRPAKGRLSNSCCAGTLVFSLDKTNDYLPLRDSHWAFIASSAPSAMCIPETDAAS